MRGEAKLDGLRLAGQSAAEALLGDGAVFLLDQLAEVCADERLLRRAVHRRARAVDPHDAAFGVYGADVLARALQDVFEQRLALARDGLDLPQLREVAHGADGSRLPLFFDDRLGGDEERAVQALRRVLQRDGPALGGGALDDAALAASRTQDVAAAPAQKLLRRGRLKACAGAVDSHQAAVVREDEDAVTQRVEGDFPGALGSRDHLEQLGLRDACGELRGDQLDERDLVRRPAARAVGLVDAERAAEAPLHDERADDLRQSAVAAREVANLLVDFGRGGFVSERVVDDERALRGDEVATDGAVVADADGAHALAAGREVLVDVGGGVGARGVVGAYEDARGREREAQLVRGGAQDFGLVERGADGVREAVDEHLAPGLSGELLGVALARDELRGLARERDRGQDALAVGRAARARVVERDEADEVAVVRDERDEQLVAVVPGFAAAGRQRAREARLEAVGREGVEEVITRRRVVGGEAQPADLDADAALDEARHVLAAVGSGRLPLDVLARDVGGVGEDAALVGRFVAEEDDEAGAVVGQARDGVGEAGEEFFQRAPFARRGGQRRQGFELAHGGAQPLARLGHLVGVDFGQGHRLAPVRARRARRTRPRLCGSTTGAERFSRGGATAWCRQRRPDALHWPRPRRGQV